MIKPDYYDLLGIDSSASKRRSKRPTVASLTNSIRTKIPRTRRPKSILNGSRRLMRFCRIPGSAPPMIEGATPWGAEISEGFGSRRNRLSGEGLFDDFFEEFFEDYWGGTKARTKRTRGSDLRYHLEISLEEAARGSEHAIQFLENPYVQTAGALVVPPEPRR